MSEDKTTLNLNKRTLTGKKIKSLREQGLVPSVIYGGDKDPILAESPYIATEKALLRVGYHSPINLDIAGKPQLALVKTVDIDPVKRTIRNIGFQAISADEIVEATTPITIINFETSEANKLHYAILQVMEEIDIKAKPADLPSELVADAGVMATLDDRITISDLKLPNGVEFSDKELDPEQVVANLYDPAAEAAAREAEEAAAAAAAETEAASEAADVPSDNGAATPETPAEETSE
jgi:large subunit ribosomal protein L25